MKNRFGASALGVCIMAASLMSLAGSAGAAAKVNATLRVVGAGNSIVVDRKVSTGTSTVKTSSKATCLGEGSLNGKTTVPGATALGILSDASASVQSLRPLAISSDLGYGLGLCTIGGVASPPIGYWALKVNHAFSQVGGAEAVLKDGDIAFWFLITDFSKPTPGELFLKLPSSVKKNSNIKATVYSYDDNGRRSVVKGAKLNGVNAPLTNGNGVTTLKLKKSGSITARKSGSLVSNRVQVNVKG